jgi:peptidoglycan-N-acetylglucosamine deacetylase
MKSLYNPPALIKKAFKNYFWETVNNKVLLTFDDGPIPDNTEAILKKLDELNIKALFFTVGENSQKYPSLTEQIISQKHTIGSHTFHHRKIPGLSSEALSDEIDKVNNLFTEKFNYQIRYFRPPHGRFDLRLNNYLKARSMKCVMWTLLTFDYKNDIELVKFAVEKYLTAGSIIVLHDSLKSKNIIMDSIDFVYEQVSKKGFQFGDAEECLK